MKRFWSTAAALLLAFVGAAGLAAPAGAAINSCASDGGYWAQGVCTLQVKTTPTCTGTGTPHLEYVATPTGTTSTNLTLTWVNPQGADVVQTNLPLSGSVEWPSASWADGSVELVFAVNPTTAVTVAHPSGVGCTSVRGALSSTGSETAPLLAGSAALVGLGAVALLVARRRAARVEA